MLPAGKVFQAGTLSGNPLATAAGCATLRLLKEDPPYERLETLSARLAEGLRDAVGDRGHVARVGSMMTLFFHPGPVMGWEQASRCDTEAFARYFWGMIDRGVYMPCSQYEALFVSAAHTEEDVERTVAAAREGAWRRVTEVRVPSPIYPEGVTSYSPGLVAQRPTLGHSPQASHYPEGVTSTQLPWHRRRSTFGVEG